MSYLASGGDVTTETEQQRYRELARFEAHHEAELTAFDAWHALLRLRECLSDEELGAQARRSIGDLLRDTEDLAAELLVDNESAQTRVTAAVAA